MRPPSPSIPEKEFLAASLKENLRLDGRLPLQMRDPVITFGPELGYVECALGKTRVIANVEAKMVKPTPERPFEGIITIHSEISPMASSEYEPGRPSEEEVTITRMLDKVLKRSDAVDKESLCIQAGQRACGLVSICAGKSRVTRCPLSGLAHPLNAPLSRGWRQHARLCMSSGDRRPASFQKTRGRSNR
ncbi:hypothetical protein CC1G_13591 [Coprinopsis cinerea okayama7|uniref:Exoribonuclease phosphorolytic domain-containing protein n=1 Tax=Coprinopsis cinerea (strain Okayama-7 / 130 / ATCC MYA-4618 / FGSC 9003) TaxID=240176 RepID=D6RJT8_COPC7|nr:hypothetical protein CC1G_13591 [Coprinopsis cinerea okayama7\|eukprot:XP_002912058.1 hypothetical protein CC1G_13591 [Coprinopsis cinerea okayama7\